MLMGNATGRKDGEGSSSGVERLEENYDRSMELAEGGAHSSHHEGASSEPMAQFLPHGPGAQQASRVSTLEASAVHWWSREGAMMQPQAQSSGQSTSVDDDMFRRSRTPVRISWKHGGKEVAVMGSWDNWQTRELLQSTGEEFVVIKMLPSGIYNYQFIVDGWLTCAPDLPWSCDDAGNTYNILDLQDQVSNLPESLAEFESPPSPVSSYDRLSLTEDDFKKPPPDLPPQLPHSIFNRSTSSNNAHQPTASPQSTELNHLFIQRNVAARYLTLSSTSRFREKYVTMILFKPFPSNR